MTNVSYSQFIESLGKKFVEEAINILSQLQSPT